MRILIASLAFGASFLALTTLRGQQGGSLAPEDYAEIQQLYARYASDVDSAAGNGAAFAGLFTADGVLTEESGKTYAGRAKLMELARTAPAKRPSNTRHLVWNVKIDPSPTGASGKAYVVVSRVAETGQPAVVIDVGQYWDDLFKTPEGWRIKRREFHKAPASAVGGPEAAPTSPPLSPSVGGSSRVQQTTGSASPPSPPASRLSADDYAQILQLYARLPYAFDGGADEGKVYAGLFTSDGIMGDARTGKLLHGSEALAGNARGTAPKNPFTTGHFLADVMLIPTSDGVVGTAYRISNSGVPVGIYFCLVVRTTEGWRFKEMHFTGPNLPVPENAQHFLQRGVKASSSQ
jgi:hypothetical protein